jgi:hypothetical protein
MGGWYIWFGRRYLLWKLPLHCQSHQQDGLVLEYDGMKRLGKLAAVLGPKVFNGVIIDLSNKRREVNGAWYKKRCSWNQALGNGCGRREANGAGYKNRRTQNLALGGMVAVEFICAKLWEKMGWHIRFRLRWVSMVDRMTLSRGLFIFHFSCF